MESIFFHPAKTTQLFPRNAYCFYVPIIPEIMASIIDACPIPIVHQSWPWDVL